MDHFKKIMASLRFGNTPHYAPDEEPPLRSELLSADQIEQYGKRLAASHKLASGHVKDSLVARLAANETLLVGAQ